MNIEELAFKDRITLAQLNELVLLDIIEFLQLDRKQWISQFTQTHNESVDIQKENQELKKQLENNSKIYAASTKYASTCEDKVIILEIQKKQFINYLEDEIKHKSLNATCMFEYNDTVLPLKEILQKYKEIIGDVKIMITNRIYEKLNNNIDVDLEEYYFSDLELENERLKRKVKKLKRKIRKLKNKNYDKQDEFVIYLEKKKSAYAESNFPKDDLFDEVQEILEKYNEVTGVFDRWEKEVSSALDKDIENFIKEFYDPMQKTTN